MVESKKYCPKCGKEVSSAEYTAMHIFLAEYPVCTDCVFKKD